jgi:large subunit ribosomal protein L44e
VKIPAIINVYCPKCNKHTPHKVKEIRKGARRTLSFGQQKFLRATKGYVSKKAGQVRKVKQSQKQTLMLECTVCKKRHPKGMPHAKKKIEIKKKE